MNITRTKHKSKTEWLQHRSHNLNSTEISSLFGCSPYMTEFELWHQKKNPTVNEFDLGERALWGNILEGAIAQGLAQQFDWSLRKINVYAEEKKLRLGSSFDFEFKTKDGKSSLLEVKNVDGFVFKKDWIEDPDTGVIEAPPHIELQVQHELLLSTKDSLTLGVLVGGNRGIAIDRAQNTKVQEAILLKADKFWWSIDNNKPPKPNFEQDAGFIMSQFNFASEGKVIDLNGSMDAVLAVDEYLKASRWEKEAKVQKDAAKAKLLMTLGDNEKGLHSDFTVSAGMVKESNIEAFTRKPYRAFRVNTKTK